jgi:hypothetical protein
MVLTIQGMDLALGMEWQWMAQSQELKPALKRQSSLSAVAFIHQGEVWLGFHPPVQTKVYAGALVLGQFYPTAIVIVDIGEGACWLCALKLGLPVAGFDLMVSTLDIERTINTWLESLSGWPIVRLSWLTVNSTEEKLLTPNEGSVQALLWPSPLEQKSLALTGKLLQSFVLSKKPKLRNQRSLTWVQLILRSVAVLLLVGALMIWGQERWQLITQAQVLKANTQKKLQGLAQEQEVQQQNLVAERNWRARVLAQKEALLLAPEPWGLWGAFEQIRHAWPVSIHGYRIDHIDCTLLECSVSWVGEGLGTQTQDQLKLPFIQKPLRADLLATSRLALNLPLVRHSRLLSEEQLDEWLLDSRGDFARRHLGFTIQAPQAIMASTQPSLGLHSPDPEAPKVIAHQGTWRMPFLAKTHLLEAAQFAQQLQSHHLLLTSIQYVPHQSLEMRGEYVFVQP